jgi:hypothetical protein
MASLRAQGVRQVWIPSFRFEPLVENLMAEIPQALSVTLGMNAFTLMGVQVNRRDTE